MRTELAQKVTKPVQVWQLLVGWRLTIAVGWAARWEKWKKEDERKNKGQKKILKKEENHENSIPKATAAKPSATSKRVVVPRAILAALFPVPSAFSLYFSRREATGVRLCSIREKKRPKEKNVGNQEKPYLIADNLVSKQMVCIFLS